MLAQQMQLANAMIPGTQIQSVVRGHIYKYIHHKVIVMLLVLI